MYDDAAELCQEVPPERAAGVLLSDGGTQRPREVNHEVTNLFLQLINSSILIFRYLHELLDSFSKRFCQCNPDLGYSVGELTRSSCIHLVFILILLIYAVGPVKLLVPSIFPLSSSSQMFGHPPLPALVNSTASVF